MNERVARSPILPFYAKLSFVCPIFQANNATLNVRIGPTVKAARNVATVKTEAVVTTFQELVLAHQDGKELCKFFILFLTSIFSLSESPPPCSRHFYDQDLAQ